MAKKKAATDPDDEPTEQSTDYPGPVAGESNARAVRNPNAPARRAGDHTGRLTDGTAGDVQPPAPKGPRQPAAPKAAARKRTAGKHRQ